MQYMKKIILMSIVLLAGLSACEDVDRIAGGLVGMRRL